MLEKCWVTWTKPNFDLPPYNTGLLEGIYPAHHYIETYIDNGN